MTVQRSETGLRFALVIPALNEEESIGSTLELSLAARDIVVEKTPVTEMFVVFVNDGSTDGTQAIADTYEDVIKVRFEKNRGYGAAIKAGFRATYAELVAFMDADGTCNPQFCVDLINNLLETDSDVSIGSRMTEHSEMPFVRRLGNTIFAKLVGAISGETLTDSASGMRVLRRSSLQRLHPLPDGLHYTPAMTCLALLDGSLKITEVPMPYKERLGRSKLSVLRDGLRFLGIILFTAALFNPLKALALLGLLFFLGGLALCEVTGLCGETPLTRFAVAGAFGFVWFQAVFVGLLCHQMLDMLMGPWRSSRFSVRLLRKFFWTMKMVRAGIVILIASLVALALALILPDSWQVPIQFIAAGGVVVAGWTALGGVVLRVVWAAKERRLAAHDDPYAVADK
ncbi:MAG: glycosyltransferase family 2 protein [Kiritimatiellae bacterium]|nr:glycosyltransferase family 2 protein [Kiritimatiellia bacterium]